jgi:hypothetical protein
MFRNQGGVARRVWLRPTRQRRHCVNFFYGFRIKQLRRCRGGGGGERLPCANRLTKIKCFLYNALSDSWGSSGAPTRILSGTGTRPARQARLAPTCQLFLQFSHQAVAPLPRWRGRRAAPVRKPPDQDKMFLIQRVERFLGVIRSADSYLVRHQDASRPTSAPCPKVSDFFTVALFER